MTYSSSTYPNPPQDDTHVSVDNFPATQTVDGSVDANVTFPVTQTVDGSISVDNFPATQTVDGSVDANVTFPVTQTVDGSISVDNLPSDKNLSTVTLDYATNGANPVTNDTLIAAPGAGSKVVIYGYQVVAQGTGAGSSGSWVISNGNAANSDYKGYGVVLGNVPTSTCISFTHGVDLSENTACNMTITETSTQVYLTGVLYYRVESI
jgi:hypothetical protein